MSRQVKDIIKEMTLEEKASLCSGLNMWQTKAVERVGILHRHDRWPARASQASESGRYVEQDRSGDMLPERRRSRVLMGSGAYRGSGAASGKNARRRMFRFCLAPR